MGAADRPWLLRGTAIALALVVGVVAWLSTREDGDGEAAPAAAGAQIVEAAELGNVAALSGRPVYWAGPVEGMSLELTESPDGSVQVRYLEEGLGAGEGSAETLTVASYPLPDPAGALDSFASEPGSIVRRSRDGRRVVTSARNPTSVYFASPDNSVQVEVYDPSPKRALSLTLSGRVRPAASRSG